MKHTENNVEYYLQSPFNIAIYNALTTGVRKGLFAPLDFFQSIHNEVRYFRRNSKNYLLVKRHYKNIKLQGEQRFYFFWILYAVLKSIDQNRDKYNNLQLQSLEIIESELNAVDELLHGKREGTFDFWRVQKHCDGLQSDNEKIKYLLEMITFCRQTGHDNIFPEFIPCCELEIEKLKAFSELNKDAQIPGQIVATAKPNEPIQASDFHKIMSGNAASKFAEIEQQLYDRGYIDTWRAGKDKQSLCGLVYLLDAKFFFGKVRNDRAILSRARRFFETRYSNNLKGMFKKSRDAKHQAEFKSLVNL